LTLLAAYDRARVALAEATRVDQVLAIRDELAHVKLYARQIQDRALLEEATVIQMRAERRLGVLIAAAKDAGQIAEGRIAKGSKVEANPDRVTLKDIGVDRRLSAKAQKAAALDDASFEQLEEQTRQKIKSGGAILVDPISAASKQAEIDGRRRAHAARTVEGGKVEDLGKLAQSGWRAGFIGMDPQWHFKTRSAAGEGRSAGVHYKTEAIDAIKEIPVGDLAGEHCALGMWTVDWCLDDAFALMRHYGFTVVTKLFTWIKTNGDDPDLKIFDPSSFHMGQGYWTRANPEDCWLATKGNPKRLYADVRQLIVAPLMEHSRKPDAWLERSERLVAGPYIELNARRPRKGWLSWGDELEWTGVSA
jgi:N6-adenosine-specific RNA methylase IME4